MIVTEGDRDRYRGALLGLACGDALGTTVEFKTRGTFEPLTTIVGGGPFGLLAGEWTDDTSMALCLAESLLENGGMDLADQLSRYTRWWRDEENSVTGSCFDIGMTVRGALENYAQRGSAYSGSTDPMSAGNGSIMRLAPVPLYFANHPVAEMVDACEESSRTTHGAAESVAGCALMGCVIRRALKAETKEEVFEGGDDFLGLKSDPPKTIREMAERNYFERDVAEISGSGYVVKSLEAALGCFRHSESFEEGALMAVNLGDDTDTTGAVFGQIAGAFYGEQGIPQHWLEIVAWRNRITRLADRFYKMATPGAID